MWESSCTYALVSKAVHSSLLGCKRCQNIQFLLWNMGIRWVGGREGKREDGGGSGGASQDDLCDVKSFETMNLII